jgi:hypothetical protein
MVEVAFALLGLAADRFLNVQVGSVARPSATDGPPSAVTRLLAKPTITLAVPLPDLAKLIFVEARLPELSARSRVAIMAGIPVMARIYANAAGADFDPLCECGGRKGK